jgi:hypothetical protein
LIIKRRRWWSSRLRLTVRVPCRTLCPCGLAWCGVDIIIAIGITNVVNHCLWTTWLTIHCVMFKDLCWRELCWQELCCQTVMLLLAALKILLSLYVGSSIIWNNVRYISKNHVGNRRAENWHRVATDNLCRFYYKPKQGQTGLKIEITSHKNIGDVALLYTRKNIMVICYLLGVGAENWHYVAT